MLTLLKKLFFSPKSKFAPETSASKESRYKVDALKSDPLEPLAGFGGSSDFKPPRPVLKPVGEYPLYEEQPSFVQLAADSANVGVMDEALPEDDGKYILKGKALDNCNTDSIAAQLAGADSAYTIPPMLAGYYQNMGFIGYQTCAYIAQHWLVQKVCTMPGEDAIRHGYEINTTDGTPIPDEFVTVMKHNEKEMRMNWTLSEFHRRVKVYGIQIAVAIVETADRNYYERPFDASRIPRGAYKGIKLVEPYWMVPMLTMESTSDPMSLQFYIPTYWVISGRKVHYSHLVVGKGPEVADILKPTYIFGGLPMTQMIYERVYAAERTANEAPLLSLSKRTTTLKADLTKIAANEQNFLQRLQKWIMFRDNYAVKVIGKDEEIGQLDTSLADFDAVIMNQYQLVAAIGKVPATKLLGTQPKGFNSSGDYEELAYNEELESIQTNMLQPVLELHVKCTAASNGINVNFEILWHAVDAMTAEKVANNNKTKADTGIALINAGVIAPDEERQRLRDDKYSGYGRLQDIEAESDIGMSPENIAELEKAKADTTKGSAAQTAATARQTSAGAQVTKVEGEEPGEREDGVAAVSAPNPKPVSTPLAQQPQEGMTTPLAGQNARAARVNLQLVKSVIAQIEQVITKEGELDEAEYENIGRAVKPGVQGIKPNVKRSVASLGEHVDSLPAEKLPKMKYNGMVLKIENPRGTIRKGSTADGKSWQVKMPHHYGYINGVTGADGDELDCFVGHDLQSTNVHVINQIDPTTKEFDEHKVMFGFNSAEDAVNAYNSSFDGGKGYMDSVVSMPMPEFKNWVACQGPLSDPCVAKETSAAVTPAVMPNSMMNEKLGKEPGGE